MNLNAYFHLTELEISYGVSVSGVQRLMLYTDMCVHKCLSRRIPKKSIKCQSPSYSFEKRSLTEPGMQLTTSILLYPSFPFHPPHLKLWACPVKPRFLTCVLRVKHRSSCWHNWCSDSMILLFRPQTDVF